MAQIREIKKRIRSITNTQKVTHAMELVAATKMRRAQQQTLASRPYSITLNEILAEVRIKSELDNPLLSKNDSPNRMVILITSDRGLAGGLNINLFREILGADLRNVLYITVGKKATAFVAKSSNDITASFASEEKVPIDLARLLTKMAIDAHVSAQVSSVSLLYPHFESTMKQIPRWIQLLPIELDSRKSPTDLPAQQPGNFLFEPSAAEILKDILPHYILTQIYQVLLEAKASEHSARMVAMKNATDAAGDLIWDLTLTYNQVRQETITKELLDIVTAQKAFE